MIAERVGEQPGLTWKSVNREPRAWMRSRFGVFKYGFPVQDRSPRPWSSVRRRMIFGRLPESGLVSAANPRLAIARRRIKGSFVGFIFWSRFSQDP
jgi:hypothetical protein